MFSIAICDNNSSDIIVTENEVRKWLGDNSSIGGTLLTFSDGAALLHAIESGRIIDLCILETGGGGIELARRINEINSGILTVFVTSSDSFAFSAYQLHALRYIKKPAASGEIREALDFAYSVFGLRPASTFFVKGMGEVIPVSADEIMYVENNIRVMTYTLSDGKTIRGTRRNISFEEALEPLQQTPGFIQTHKSYFVNMKYISALRSDSVLMKNGREIPISRKNLACVRREYMAFVRRPKPKALPNS